MLFLDLKRRLLYNIGDRVHRICYEYSLISDILCAKKNSIEPHCGTGERKMKDTLYGELSVIGMRGCEDFVSQVDAYLQEWRRHDTEGTFLVDASCPRFGSGEAKGALHQSLRGNDVYIICDVFNHGVTYNMYGQTVPMSPDDHFQDLKRIIGAIGGKARRISVIMPMLYEGRQHKRSGREALDCALTTRGSRMPSRSADLRMCVLRTR